MNQTEDPTISLDGEPAAAPRAGGDGARTVEAGPGGLAAAAGLKTIAADDTSGDAKPQASDTADGGDADGAKAALDALLAEVASYRAHSNVAAFRASAESEAQVLGLTFRERDADAAPWEMFARALTEKISGVRPLPGIQLVTSPVAAAWNDPQTGKYQAWRVLGDTMPSWGYAYRGTQQQVSAGYYAFITNLDIPLPDSADRARAEAARREYTTAVDALQNAQGDVGPHWDTFNKKQSSLPAPRRLTFDQWYARFDGQKIASLLNQTRLAGQAYQTWLVRAYKGYAFVADLVQNFDNPAFQLSAESTDGLMGFYRTYGITPDLGAWIEASKKLAADKAPPGIAFSFDRNSGRLSSSETSWGGKTSWFGGWWSFGAGAGGTRSTLDTSHEHFRMRFEAVSWETFRITPGQWFNGTAVKALKDGPWVPDGPVAKGLLKFWGPDGIFGLMPSEAVAVFRPTVSVTVAKDEYHSVKSEFFAKGGFSIGPFGFGASYRRRTEDVSWDDSSNTITATDSSDTPQIVAVVSTVLPNFE